MDTSIKKGDKISDIILAKETENIYRGTYTTFLDALVVLKNKSGIDVLVNQVGWAGIMLGRLNFEFSKLKRKILLHSHTAIVRKKTNE